jgi:hypothetical protein
MQAGEGEIKVTEGKKGAGRQKNCVRELPADRGLDQGPAVCLHWPAVFPAIALGNERTPWSTVNSLLVQRPLHTALTRWSLGPAQKQLDERKMCLVCLVQQRGLSVL